MSTIAEVSTGRSATALDAESTTASRVPQKVLQQQDFLKLLATQFQMQDPLKPKEDTAFIAQMAQFTALEQANATNEAMTALRADQARVTANSYLGHRVTIDTGGGATAVGEVTAVEASSGEPMLVIAGTPHALSAVLRVEPVLVSTPRSGTAGGA
jgi:flagellar basal-body rod modification protein FlgD